MTTSGYTIAHEYMVPARDGRRLHVYEAGPVTGELVLVHHGTPGSGLLWDRWAGDAMSRGIRLVGYDRPGYGDSDRHPGRAVADVAADAATIADSCGVDRFRTWGGSGGGPHALACAALLPDRVIAAASLASPAPYEADGLAWFDGMGEDNLDEFAAAEAGEATLRPYLTEASQQMVKAGPDGLAEAMRSLLPAVDVEVLTGDLATFMHEWVARGQRTGVDGWVDDDLAFVRPWGFDPTSIRVPLLLRHGRHDLMVPFAHGQWLAGQVRGTTQFTDTDGHLTLLAAVGDVHDWLLAQH
jgi:pimeloyl-ACP methyl ester carboxylesterase